MFVSQSGNNIGWTKAAVPVGRTASWTEPSAGGNDVLVNDVVESDEGKEINLATWISI